MKKFFTFALALMTAVALNATDYFFAGGANGWSNNSDAWKFVEVDGVLTLEVEDLFGEFKITEDGNWHPQHGAAADGEGVALNGTYNLVKCDDSEGEKDAPANCKILFPIEGDWRYKDAKLTLDASDPDHLVIALVASTLYNHAETPKTYQIVGAFNGWDAAGAPSFEEVDGKLTVSIADLSGTFKIIEDHAWTNQWATNWETGGGLVLGEPYVLGAKGDNGEPANLALANPFGGFKNAVLTLDISGEDFVLTLESGDFALVENDWFVPGNWNGWQCNDASKMDPVSGKANTYELLLAELSGYFKVVYGQWAVEFGAAKNSSEQWSINTSMRLSSPCDYLKPMDSEAKYKDVTITIFVDYEKANVVMFTSTSSYSSDINHTKRLIPVNYQNGTETFDIELVTFEMPYAPVIEGFTFLKWIVGASDLEDGINIQAVYEANKPTSAPEVVNPANKAQKLIRDGNVYILTEERTYNVQGIEVK